MDGSDFLYSKFISDLPHKPTSCQEKALRAVASFLQSGDGDILILNGFAGTGKTTVLSSVVSVMTSLSMQCILLAPTGRSAKVLSSYTGRPAYTIHKHIYRQKSHGDDGFGRFTLSPNKAKGALFVVDEVSLIGLDGGSEGASFGSGNLLGDLITFVRNGVDCKLILSGDSAQLPPVGMDESPALSPEFMNDSFGGVFHSTLTTVVRQQSESLILENATRIRELITNSVGDIPLNELRLVLDGHKGSDGVAARGFVNGRGPGLPGRDRPEGPYRSEPLCPQGLERVSGAELLETLTDAYGKYGEDEVIVLCRSNKRANRYNMGIRAQVLYREEKLVREDKLMIVKNCYHFVEDMEGTDYIANGDIATLLRISGYEELYGFHFADARLSFPDYDNQEIVAKVLLDTLESESPSLTYEESGRLYHGVDEDYSHITVKKKRYEAVREDPFYNALQIKYAAAITAHKSQGGQWKCVFIDNPFWQDILSREDLKWLYTAITRAVEKVYLINFKDELFV